jgi:hypothetical protein
MSSIKSIVKEDSSKPPGTPGKFVSPKKSIKKPAPTSPLDEFEEETVRRVIYNFTVIQKGKPSMQTIFDAVKQEGVCLERKLTTSRNVVKKLGFTWGKTKDNRMVLIKTSEIRSKRTVGGQIKLGHLKFNLCKSDH